MIKLVGILIVVFGFVLKIDTISVVIAAGIATGLAAGMSINDILSTLGTAFIQSRYMSIFLLSIPAIALIENNGLREVSARMIVKIKGVTPGRIASLYVVMRTIISAMAVRLQGHVQFIRPLIFPMIQGSAEIKGPISSQKKEFLKGLSCAVENYGNFFGQNVFVASGGVLLIVGVYQEAGITVSPSAVALGAVPSALCAIILSIIQNKLADKKINKE